MLFFRRFSKIEEGTVQDQGTTTAHDAPGDFVSEGGLKFTVEQGGNESQPSYQEVSGAPVETHSPLGYSVGPLTIMFLNISKMVGTGVYSTPSSVLTGTGSVGLSLIFWFIGSLIAARSLSVYLEYASYFPNRSGSEVVYLEQAYPRPKYLLPLAFAAQSVILSFSSSNAIVLARYLFRINGHAPSDWELKGVAIAGYSIAVLLLLFHTRFSYWISNSIGVVKLITLVFVAITGLVVLGGNTNVTNLTANFQNSFEGASTAYGVTNALVKVIFSYAGYDNAFNVVNEVKNPVKTIHNNAFISLFIVTTLYEFANIAYLAAVPKAELKKSSQIAASLFFEKVFGKGGAVRGLNFLIALSAFGNIITVLLGQSRLIRECGRQGVLPWPRFWASTEPFGTPTGPYFLKWALTILMILAPPAGDAFNFVVDLRTYPQAFFDTAMAVGLFFVRYRRKKLGAPPSEFRAYDIVIAFSIFSNVYLLIMPWYPPVTGRNGGDVSFWYATYVVVGIAILVLCGLYYCVWVYCLPRLGNYVIRQEVLILDNGVTSHSLIKVPNSELEAWDAKHDALGRSVNSSSADLASEGTESHGSGFQKEQGKATEEMV
ncbi:LAT family L-amino acid transporter [Amylocarpus encephaloides]|uniref:LAT family L-amino acid transporter n=1 Tax=Amylocarpus encephaloides TaxID=45428 RepID=A0A9P8C0Q9_9HELO|nr:LAT family L-amino acid transporter [Amylocarpus encephaloides]